MFRPVKSPHKLIYKFVKVRWIGASRHQPVTTNVFFIFENSLTFDLMSKIIKTPIIDQDRLKNNFCY